jgi:prepilin-type N-terminal cleavage/methylation domain-containing protein
MVYPGRGSGQKGEQQWRDGFTLVEVVVALAVLASLIAIASPQFIKLYARARASLEQEDLERQLLELPQKVRDGGRAGILADPSAGHTSSAADMGFDEPQVLRIDLPEGWSMQVPKPIFYHFTGACDGGEVTLSLPPLTLHYVLTAPLCRPRLVDAG